MQRSKKGGETIEKNQKKSRQALIRSAPTPAPAAKAKARLLGMGGPTSRGVGPAAGTHREQDRTSSVLGANTTHASRAQRLLRGQTRPCGILDLVSQGPHQPRILCPRVPIIPEPSCPGLSPGLGRGKAAYGFSTAWEGEKKIQRVSEKWKFLPLPGIFSCS